MSSQSLRMTGLCWGGQVILVIESCSVILDSKASSYSPSVHNSRIPANPAALGSARNSSKWTERNQTITAVQFMFVQYLGVWLKYWLSCVGSWWQYKELIVSFDLNKCNKCKCMDAVLNYNISVDVDRIIWPNLPGRFGRTLTAIGYVLRISLAAICMWNDSGLKTAERRPEILELNMLINKIDQGPQVSIFI